MSRKDLVVTPGFEAHVALVCACGQIMQLTEQGAYCVNPVCVLSANLYQVTVRVDELPYPEGASA
jgi:hypothetical protein